MCFVFFIINLVFDIEIDFIVVGILIEFVFIMIFGWCEWMEELYFDICIGRSGELLGVEGNVGIIIFLCFVV